MGNKETNNSIMDELVAKKILVIYDSSNTKVAKKYAIQAAKDHFVTAHAPSTKRFIELINEKPDIIYSFGHGWKNRIAIGLRTREKGYKKRELTEILQNANLKEGTKFIFHHCSCGATDAILQKIANKLPNLEFYGNTNSGDGVRNFSKRNVSLKQNLPSFIKEMLKQDFLILDKKEQKKHMRHLLKPDTFINRGGERMSTNEESSKKSGTHILFREIPAMGFNNFWELVKGNNVNLDALQLTDDAKQRLDLGIERFQQRFNKIRREVLQNILE